MMEIKLGSKGVALIDDEDFAKINFCSWFLQKDTHNQYAKNKKHKSMHRVIMNAKPGEVVDHIDGDGLNNQKSNLRICTQKQNICNKKVLSKKYSKFLGVFKEGNRWYAACRSDGILHKKKAIDEMDAANQYNSMAIKYHGEFARLNKTD